MNRTALFLVLVSAGPVLFVPASVAQDADAVSILLRSEAVVDDSLVTLGHVAKLSGGTEATRRRLANLDIAEFNLGAADMTVRSEQVRFRLLLAGLEEAQFRLSGAKQTLIVESDEPATVRKVLVAAQQALAVHYPGNLAHATITPNRGVNVPSLSLRSGERVRLEASAKTPVSRTGTARLEVALTVSGKTREIVPVTFEIATTEITPTAGGRDRSSVRVAGYVTPALEDRDFVIKSKDNVRIVAHVANARIEALGEAQQDGRLGDIIRVKNIESNRVVHGRVEAGGLVIVDY